MKISKELIGMLVLVGLFIALTLLFTGHGSDSSSRLSTDDPQTNWTDDPSFDNSRSGGSLAAFTLTRKLGYRPVAWRRGWNSLSTSGSQTLLLINPQFDTNISPLTGMPFSAGQSTYISASDWPILQSWLKAGNNVVLLTSDLQNSAAQKNSSSSTFGDAAGLWVTNSTSNGNSKGPVPVPRRNFSPALPGPYTNGVLSVYSESDARVKQTVANGPALFGDRRGALVLCKPVGSGHLIVISDALLFSNARLGCSDNAVFLADLLTQTSKTGGIVLFDEYHHGDAVEDSGATMWSVLGKPLQLAIIQGCVAFLALIIVLAVRFGRPISLTQGQSRHTGEYVASLAALHRRAGATTIALETIYRQFLRDLCVRLGISPDTRLDILAKTAAKRTNISEMTLRNLLTLCEQRLDEGRLPENELLELVRQMEQIRKDVGIA